MKEKNNPSKQETICLRSGFVAETDLSRESDIQLKALNKLCYENILRLDYSDEKKAIPNVKFLGVCQFGLDPEEMNCRRCEKCPCWTTENSQKDILTYLLIGREVEGLYMCIQCEDAPIM